MDIHRMEREAQERQLNGEPLDFFFQNHINRKKARWIDAYFGAFQVEGEKGFMMVRDVADLPLDCEWADAEPQP